jgi:hypothetical protein
MAFTPHNNLETIDTGTENWDSSINDNFEHLEKGLTIKAVAGLTITKSQITYIDSNGEFQLAIADGTVANRYIGPATTAINRQVDGYAQNSGYHLDADWSWTVGNPLYLSSSVAGALTETEPAESILVGIAIATNQITVRPWLEPSDNSLTVANGGTGRNTATAYAVICGGTNATAEHQSIAGLGTSGQVLTSNGPGALPTMQAVPGAGGGTLIQTVVGFTGEYSTGSTTIPADDTIPQNTEGDQYMSLAITPQVSTNRLLINVHVEGTANTANTYYSAALFQDSIADALTTSQIDRNNASDHWGSGHFMYTMIAGTTSEITFKVRCGNASAGTFYFNGNSGGRTAGGRLASGMIIQEIEV